MPVVLVVATVDDPAVLVGAMQNLGSEKAATLAAFYLARENAHSAVTSTRLLAPCYLCLHHLEGGRGDNGRTALLHKVAGDLPVVLHSLLREEIRCECLLDSCHPSVLLIS